jgi:hypothetical protein
MTRNSKRKADCARLGAAQAKVRLKRITKSRTRGRPASLRSFCADLGRAKKTAFDKKRIAKAERQAGRKGQWKRLQERGYSLIRGKTKIEGRGFDRTLSKKFSGEVIRRDR